MSVLASACLTLDFLIICAFLNNRVYYALAGIEAQDCGLVDSKILRNTNQVAQIDEFPWMARLAYNNSQATVFLCQAVLITHRYLLTVSHCLGALGGREPYAALLGDWDITNNWMSRDCEQISGKCTMPLLLDIEEIVVNPYFDWNRHINDMGLLRLNQTVIYTQFIRPICLPNHSDMQKNFDAKELILTGFMRRARGFRQRMLMPVFERENCTRIYREQDRFTITDAHLCGIACDDDAITFLSSSALMDVKSETERERMQVYLVGVISYRTLTCVPGVPDVFTRVDHYLDWIENNVVE